MSTPALTAARILAVDDEPGNLVLLQKTLERAGYSNIAYLSDPTQVLASVAESPPDLILLDLHMAPIDGFNVMEQLHHLVDEQDYLPILVLTADITPATKRRALSMGAKDFVTKPFSAVELTLRVHNLLETRYFYLAQRSQNQRLEQRVLERTRELELAQLDAVDRLAWVAEFRDDVTQEHTRRVSQGAMRLALALGLSDDESERFGRVAPLHDIGKIGVPDAILLKPSGLTPEEFEQAKQHTFIGARLLAEGRSELFREAEHLALTHHERWDGSGYPYGMRGSAIPLLSRIVSVVDVFDTLTHVRPYKSAWTLEQAAEEMKRQSGSHFDPDILAVFLERVAGW